MISYELAKKLKEAGWPQGSVCQRHLHILGNGDFCDNEECELLKKYDEKNAKQYITLEELIEACGENFIDLAFRHRLNKNIWYGGVNKWYASGMTEPVTGVIEAWGSTPEEAVSELWLSLNKK